MTLQQIERLRELEWLIAREDKGAKAKLFAEELQQLTTLELEMQSQIPLKLCPHGSVLPVGSTFENTIAR